MILAFDGMTEAIDNTVKIAEKLQEVGAVRCPTIFRLYSKFKKYDSQYKYGLYTFKHLPIKDTPLLLTFGEF